ncbi:MAG: N-acetyltransferase [Anaerolineales bacterium]|nr:N-acetyltransferase [Anaerolineales bacterium]MBS3752747.1 N-acetyltransferase [Anaerolineales bacterium]
MQVHIRRSNDTDLQAICNTVSAAFDESEHEEKEIANLVLDLLADPTTKPFLSLVAFAEETIVGYILFTKVHIMNSGQDVSASILAPLAVKPVYQNMGIGSLLVNEGIKQLKDMGFELVFVLGHPTYYPKFGFIPAGKEGFEAPYSISQEHADAWMVKELKPGTIENTSGKVKCADTLNEPKYW